MPADLLDRVARVIEAQERAVLFTVVEGEPLGAVLLVTGGERLGSAPPAVAESFDEVIRGGRNRVLEIDGMRVFAEVYGPPPRLRLRRRGHRRGALRHGEADRLAHDRRRRARQVRHARASAERRRARGGVAEEALEQVAPDHATAVVVLTHDEKFDVPALKGALETEAFVGALGSRRNQAKRRERLLEAGVDEAELDRISGPAGLDIGADTPAETALSILAEILAHRPPRGRLAEERGGASTWRPRP